MPEPALTPLINELHFRLSLLRLLTVPHSGPAEREGPESRQIEELVVKVPQQPGA